LWIDIVLECARGLLCRGLKLLDFGLLRLGKDQPCAKKQSDHQNAALQAMAGRAAGPLNPVIAARFHPKSPKFGCSRQWRVEPLAMSSSIEISPRGPTPP